MNQRYSKYTAALQKIADVKYASAVLQWDQETYLPSQGASARTRQLATLSELEHKLATDPELGILLQSLLSDQLDNRQHRNVLLSYETYQKQLKYTAKFVRQMSESVSAAFHSWIEARRQNDFSLFAPALESLVQLKRQEADLLGFSEHPYNALMDQYEKGATVAMVDQVFADVLPTLNELLKVVMAKPVPDDGFLYRHYPKDQQWQWGMYLVKQLGFDLEAGRQDISEHPFTTNFSAKDVRITTRIDEYNIANLTWSCIHEAGHALYEQGLPDSDYGLPSGEYASLSIHESQSRLWENCVGRSKEFWTAQLPALAGMFPQQLAGVSLDQFIAAINKVAPSLVRTEADELTYHFHIYIRYALEKMLINGELKTADIPAFWNEQYKRLLGIEVPDDKQGCLQDVHWSHGSFGYFPTYSLGSFYAAQLWQAVNSQYPGIGAEIAMGNTDRLLTWLRQNIHQHGRTYTSEELCRMATGEPLNSTAFIAYLSKKYQ